MPPHFLYGLLIGLGQLLATLLVFALGFHNSAETLQRAVQLESLIGFILLMAVVSLSYRAAKARNETTTIGRAAKSAALTALAGGVFTGLGQYVYLAIINPGLREIQRSLIIEGAKAHLATLSPEKLAEDMRHIDAATSPLARAVGYAAPTFIFATLLGIAFALIFRAAIRRDEAAGRQK